MKLDWQNKGGRPRSREAVLASKPKRKPLSGGRDILTVENLNPEFRYVWANDFDHGMNLHRFEEAGYEYVTSKGVIVGHRTVDMSEEAEDHGSVVQRRVGTTENGEPLMAYLMAIEKEFFEEDQKNKDKYNREIENSLRANPNHGQYGNIEIKHGRR